MKHVILSVLVGLTGSVAMAQSECAALLERIQTQGQRCQFSVNGRTEMVTLKIGREVVSGSSAQAFFFPINKGGMPFYFLRVEDGDTALSMSCDQGRLRFARVHDQGFNQGQLDSKGEIVLTETGLRSMTFQVYNYGNYGSNRKMNRRLESTDLYRFICK